MRYIKMFKNKSISSVEYEANREASEKHLEIVSAQLTFSGVRPYEEPVLTVVFEKKATRRGKGTENTFEQST